MNNRHLKLSTTTQHKHPNRKKVVSVRATLMSLDVKASFSSPSSRQPTACTLSFSSQCWGWRHNKCRSPWWPGWTTLSSFSCDPVKKDLEGKNCQQYGRVDEFDDRRDVLLYQVLPRKDLWCHLLEFLTCQEQERSMWGLVGEGKQGRAERQSRRNIPGYDDLSSSWNFDHPLGCL